MEEGFTADKIMVKVRLDDCDDRAKGISCQKMMEEFMSSFCLFMSTYDFMHANTEYRKREKQVTLFSNL